MHAAARHAWRVRAALVRPRGGATRSCSSFSASTAEETVDWPIIAGGVLGVGLLLSGLALKRQAWLQKVQSRVDIVPSGGMIADVSVRQLIGLTMAFALTQLPVEETKLKLLAAGGLQGWGALLGCFELDQQQIALGALTALLDGDAPLRAFHEQTAWYTQLTEVLPPLLHPSPGSLSDPEILLDILWLGSALVTHPAYVQSPEDAWLWSRLLEQSAEGLDLEPNACLSWACVAAAAAEKPGVADAMLESAAVKRQLVRLADDGSPPPPLEGLAPPPAEAAPAAGSISGALLGSSPSALQVLERAEALETAYARLALHRLSQAAEARGSSRPSAATESAANEQAADELAAAAEEVDEPEPFVAQYLHAQLPPLPPRPPREASAVSREEKILTSLSTITTCGVGGAVWGLLRGALPSARARWPVRRSALMATAGAMGFEAAMQLKLELKGRLRGATHGTYPPPLYRGSIGFCTAMALDSTVSCALLYLLIQPGRCVFAFGGWALGRSFHLSQDLLDLQLEIEMD